MQYLNGFISDITSVINTIRITDIIDIAIVAFLVYKAAELIKEIRAAQLLKGIGLIFGAYFLASQFNLKTISFLLSKVLEFGALALIVVFQPELRRVLEQMGNSQLLRKFQLFKQTGDSEQERHMRNNLVAVANAASELSEDKTGALIVLERKTRLGDIINTGILLRAVISKELLCNIFFHNSPMHDGAVIIRDGQVYAAGCFLPLTSNFTISKDFGTRHRAALGISENSDCLVVVVSEETGNISLAKSGVLRHNLHKDDLVNILFEEFMPEKDEENSEDKPKKQNLLLEWFGKKTKSEQEKEKPEEPLEKLEEETPQEDTGTQEQAEEKNEKTNEDKN